ncbi:MAG TPA: GNAT family N-acetyltransferase [Ideonella sp.]|uniref:GNAT family N-acetyltransferase n=1 Tax=Ideonella sp. TaxID=1929293 RepID=UPI002E306215|nr:GNAT family N-acetyltransferase [Ideonella sp.]HEX5685501.1 GNAT family N-acetyltransferase [Ideonella sp.]
MPRSTDAPTPAFTLRPAAEADVPFLLHLRETAMDPHHRAAGIVQTPAEMEERVRSHWEEAQVIEVDGRPVGLWKLWRQPAAWWILQVQLMPAFQGHGIGATLIRALQAEALAAQMPLKLKVLKSNPARQLYERLGFVIVGEGEHGWEMQAGGLEPPASASR